MYLITFHQFKLYGHVTQSGPEKFTALGLGASQALPTSEPTPYFIQVHIALSSYPQLPRNNVLRIRVIWYERAARRAG